MKKVGIVLLMLSLLLSLAACGESGETAKNVAGEDVTEQGRDVPVTIDQVPFEIIIQEPDSIGEVYGLATYTNNSQYPITGFDLTILLKDRNEKTDYMTYDTVMPGETSPQFETFAPKTQSLDDIEYLKLSLTVNIDGEDKYIEYDYKLDKYEVY